VDIAVAFALLVVVLAGFGSVGAKRS